MYFTDRKDAGQKLARALNAYKDKPDTIILALPRGGVPVAYEAAIHLHIPLDLMLVRKLGVPENEELAMGAIAMGVVIVLNEEIIRSFHISPKNLEQVIKSERTELARRNNAYRNGQAEPDVKGKTVILIDDGIATGANMRAAVQAMRRQEAAEIVVATPVSSREAFEALNILADNVILLDIPEPFYGVGRFYQDFSQTSDEEVKTLLKQIKGKNIDEHQGA
ncbi:MAG TPA: phosphoribosyltransferase [Rickettsiales bacterium]|nr:phosphoribosyltransferase [Rickettsiales bacterium]